MKTYRINKYAERLAQGTGFAPELIYNISLVRFQGRNGRCIAAWTPGIKRPRYVYKVHTPEEYDKAMERIRQEAERFRHHDEAGARSSEEFRAGKGCCSFPRIAPCRRHPLLVVGLGADQYRLLSGHSDPRQRGRPAAARSADYRGRVHVRDDRADSRRFQR